MRSSYKILFLLGNITKRASAHLAFGKYWNFGDKYQLLFILVLNVTCHLKLAKRKNFLKLTSLGKKTASIGTGILFLSILKI